MIHTQETRQILYIGAHVDHGNIANGRASSILEKVGLYGERIEGVIVSSCLVASREKNLAYLFLESGIRWVFGYT